MYYIFKHFSTYLFMDLLQEFNLFLQGLSSVFGVEVGKGFVVQVLEKSKWFKSLITYRLD